MGSSSSSRKTKYIVDIIIPTMNEKGYVEHTIKNLMNQTLYKKGQIHIGIGDFKNDLNWDDTELYDFTKKYEHIDYMIVDRKGIAYARNVAIDELSKSNIIMNFDADSIFNRPDAVKKMIEPIIDKDVKLTNCPCLFYDVKTGKIDNSMTNIYEYMNFLGLELEKHLVSRGQGLTVDKDTFYEVGKFQDVAVGEDYLLSLAIVTKYSYRAKKYIDDVIVFSSNRRVRSADSEGVKVFDYSRNNYR